MTTYAIPTIETLAATAADLAAVAHDAGDRRNENAINKAIYHLTAGLDIFPTTGGFLVPSGTRGGVVHRVSTSHGCSCEAGAAGVGCWHLSAIEIIAVAQERIVRKVSYEEAMAAMNELFA
jgi:hypothetical protein